MGLVKCLVGNHFVGGVEALEELRQDVEVTLALGGFNHAKCFSAELLPFLALRLASRFGGAGDSVDGGALSEVLSLECSDLGRCAGHGSRFVVEALASCPHILQALLPVSRGASRIS